MGILFTSLLVIGIVYIIYLHAKKGKITKQNEAVPGRSAERMKRNMRDCDIDCSRKRYNSRRNVQLHREEVNKDVRWF